MKRQCKVCVPEIRPTIVHSTEGSFLIWYCERCSRSVKQKPLPQPPSGGGETVEHERIA